MVENTMEEDYINDMILGDMVDNTISDIDDLIWYLMEVQKILGNWQKLPTKFKFRSATQIKETLAEFNRTFQEMEVLVMDDIVRIYLP